MSSVGAIVLAAGSGTRFGAAKQFAELRPGVRLVDAAVAAVAPVTRVLVVVLPAGTSWDGAGDVLTAIGGADRRASVAAGLAALPDEIDVVLLHDASHPLVPPGTVEQLLDAVATGADCAVPFWPAAEVVKRRSVDGRLTTVGRDGLGLAQMPMAFTRRALAASLAHDDDAYEDSARVEALGGRVLSVPGSALNLHVVEPQDLELARRLAG